MKDKLSEALRVREVVSRGSLGCFSSCIDRQIKIKSLAVCPPIAVLLLLESSRYLVLVAIELSLTTNPLAIKIILSVNTRSCVIKFFMNMMSSMNYNSCRYLLP